MAALELTPAFRPSSAAGSAVNPLHPTASFLGVVWRVRGLVSHVLPQERLGLRGEEH